MYAHLATAEKYVNTVRRRPLHLHVIIIYGIYGQCILILKCAGKDLIIFYFMYILNTLLILKSHFAFATILLTLSC